MLTEDDSSEIVRDRRPFGFLSFFVFMTAIMLAQRKIPVICTSIHQKPPFRGQKYENDTNDDANTIGELAWYPGQASYCLISTTSSIGAHLMNGGTEVKTYPALAKTFGYNFFEAAGEKFVAWTSLIKGNDKPRLQIVQSDASTLDKMQDTFDNLATRLVYEAPLQNADNMEAEGVGGGNTVCDCCVREINGEIYIAAMAQKAGLSLFKVSAK